MVHEKWQERPRHESRTNYVRRYFHWFEESRHRSIDISRACSDFSKNHQAKTFGRAMGRSRGVWDAIAFGDDDSEQDGAAGVGTRGTELGEEAAKDSGEPFEHDDKTTAQQPDLEEAQDENQETEVRTYVEDDRVMFEDVSEHGEEDAAMEYSPTSPADSMRDVAEANNNHSMDSPQEQPRSRLRRMRFDTSTPDSSGDRPGKARRSDDEMETALNHVSELRSQIADELRHEDQRILMMIIKGVDVSEIFSPPRVASMVVRTGFTAGTSMALKTGWDFPNQSTDVSPLRRSCERSHGC